MSYEVCFLNTSTLKSPKTTIGQIVGDFDINSWSVDDKIIKIKMGAYKLQWCELLEKC